MKMVITILGTVLFFVVCILGWLNYQSAVQKSQLQNMSIASCQIFELSKELSAFAMANDRLPSVSNFGDFVSSVNPVIRSKCSGAPYVVEAEGVVNYVGNNIMYKVFQEYALLCSIDGLGEFIHEPSSSIYMRINSDGKQYSLGECSQRSKDGEEGFKMINQGEINVKNKEK